MARRSPRLRTRVTLFFGVLALVGGLGLTVATYVFARNSLLSERQISATSRSIGHASEVHEAYSNPGTIDRVLVDLDIEPDGYAVVLPSGWSPNSDGPSELVTRNGISADDFPPELLAAAADGQPARQQFTDGDGDHVLGVTIPVNAYDVAFVEAFPLATTSDTLNVLATALVVGAILATLVAVAFGWSTSRRLLRPITDVADAAEDIAAGALDARLDDEDDPDLKRLAGSFNDMADAVQQRIEREQRFASDVSHELRSPITALSAAVEVLAKRRADLPERTRQALDVVVGQVRRFDAMVIDLLELSRLEAGAHNFNQEPLDIVDLCHRIATRFGFDELPIDVQPRANTRALVDRLRFERILGNLLENADTHAGGPTRMSIEPAEVRHGVLIIVEDHGPGVATSERTRIFERFARGSAARARIGTGLGLALVAEHAAALGGEAWVEERNGGGARFVVRLPTHPAGIDGRLPSDEERVEE